MLWKTHSDPRTFLDHFQNIKFYFLYIFLKIIKGLCLVTCVLLFRKESKIAFSKFLKLKYTKIFMESPFWLITIKYTWLWSDNKTKTLGEGFILPQLYTEVSLKASVKQSHFLSFIFNIQRYYPNWCWLTFSFYAFCHREVSGYM